MMIDEEDLPTTGEDSDNVGIFKRLSSDSHIFFSSIEGIEAFEFRKLIQKYNLSSLTDHTMACIAKKG